MDICLRCGKTADPNLDLFCHDCYHNMPYSVYVEFRKQKKLELQQNFKYPPIIRWILRILIVVIIVTLVINKNNGYALLCLLFYWLINSIVRFISIQAHLERVFPQQIPTEREPVKREKKSDIPFSSLIDDVHSKYYESE